MKETQNITLYRNCLNSPCMQAVSTIKGVGTPPPLTGHSELYTVAWP